MLPVRTGFCVVSLESVICYFCAADQIESVRRLLRELHIKKKSDVLVLGIVITFFSFLTAVYWTLSRTE